jgi:SSS family transporter
VKTFVLTDYAVVLGYLLIVATIGSSFYRKKSTPREYFLGGRSIPWLAAGISIIAADLSAITVMGVPAWTYRNNLELAWMSLSYPLVAPIVIRVFVPFYASLNLFTAYEYLEKRFNLGVRLLASGQFLCLRCAHVAIALYGPSLVINLVTGLPVWECIVFMGLFTTVYTTLGGMKAVIWTDVIQFCTVTLGIVLIFVTAVAHVNGGLAGTYRIAAEAGKLRFLNLSTDPAQLTSIWAILIGTSVLTLSATTTDQAVLQRLLVTRSPRDCRQSVILQAILNVPMTLLLFLAGTVLAAFYKTHPSHLAGLNSPDALVPFFAIQELPRGISGLVIAAIFAASMAVMSAGINSLTTASTVDFYQRLMRPGETAQRYAAVGRFGTLCWGTLATVLALFAGKLGDLALAYNRVNAFVCGPMLGMFLLGILTARTTAAGSLIGAGTGAAVVFWISLSTRWSFFLQAPIGVLVTVAVGYGSSLFMAPPSREKIAGFVLGRPERREAGRSMHQV